MKKIKESEKDSRADGTNSPLLFGTGVGTPDLLLLCGIGGGASVSNKAEEKIRRAATDDTEDMRRSFLFGTESGKSWGGRWLKMTSQRM